MFARTTLARGTAIDLLVGAAVIGLAWFVGTFVVMHAIQPDLHPLESLGSQYANGTAGWLMNLGFIMAGLGTIALARALWSSVEPGRRARGAVLAMGIAGVGFAGSGVFPEDVPLEDGTVGYSFSGGMHFLSGVLLFVGVIVATFMLAGVFRRDSRWHPWSRVTRGAGWLLLAGLVASLVLGSGAVGPASGMEGSVAGLAQRIFVAIMVGWLIWLALRVRGLESSPARR